MAARLLREPVLGRWRESLALLIPERLGRSAREDLIAGLTLAVVIFRGQLPPFREGVVAGALAPLARFIPMASLAGILMVTSFRMVEWQSLRLIPQAAPHYNAVLLTTLS